MKTAISLRTAQAIVNRSAKLLDNEVPQWHKKINLDTFHMGDESSCICGQLGITERANPDFAIPDSKRKYRKTIDELAYSVTRGFYVPLNIGGSPKWFDIIGRLWEYQINKRLRCDEKKAIDAMYRC